MFGYLQATVEAACQLSVDFVKGEMHVDRNIQSAQ